jgi:hypothetical protein
MGWIAISVEKEAGLFAPKRNSVEYQGLSIEESCLIRNSSMVRSQRSDEPESRNKTYHI